MIIVHLVIFGIVIASNWMIFEKAGQEGWKSIIPFYNIYVLLQIVGRPVWWLILFFIPIANIVAAFLLCADLAKCFGKDTLYAIGLIFLPFIFMPMLAFTDAQYTPISHQ